MGKHGSRLSDDTWLYGVPAVVAVAVFITLLACSPTRTHKTLTFFFDGVPDSASRSGFSLPDTFAQPVKFTGTNRIPTRNEIASSVYHPPYKERNCSVCHEQGSMVRSATRQFTVCNKCHESFEKKFPKLHGPVGSGYCTACHNPHLADNPDLLIRKGQKLCTYCHDAGQVKELPVHRLIGDGDCTECHNPHGGGDETLLK